ncbi:MAG TPA: hypothetical protein PLD09_05005, partial [Methanomassiliicoccaceae archaeon]|nr:hypothetical protein [Methanomassiliicoccaceae archaeon]
MEEVVVKERSMVDQAKLKLALVMGVGLLTLFIFLMISWALGAVDIPFYETLGHMSNIIVNFGPEHGNPMEHIIWSR